MSNPAINALLQPMAITEGWLRVLADRALDPKADYAKDSAVSMRADDDDKAGIHVVRISGPLSKEPSMWAWFFGGTSYAGIKHEIDEGLESGQPVLLRIDSPGGEVYGCGELADYIYRARESGARIEAYIEGQGDSAAYWIASACDKVTINASGEAGSIGVRCVVVDDSKALEAMGIAAYDIVADQSPLKVVDASDPKDRARVKAQMTAFAGVFVSAVARGRGVSIDKVLNDFGRGDVMVGEAAVKAGLADEVGTLESVLAAMTATNNGANMKATANAAQGNPTPAASVGNGKCTGCDDDMDDSDPMYCKACAKGGASAQAFIDSLGALVGAKGEAAIVGAITGLKVQAEKATALQTELDKVRKDKANADAQAQLDKACAVGRIAPADRAKFDEVFAKYGIEGLTASLSVLKPAATPATPPTEEQAKDAAVEATAKAPNAKPATLGYTEEQLKMLKAVGVDPAKAADHKKKLTAIMYGQPTE